MVIFHGEYITTMITVFTISIEVELVLIITNVIKNRVRLEEKLKIVYLFEPTINNTLTRILLLMLNMNKLTVN